MTQLPRKRVKAILRTHEKWLDHHWRDADLHKTPLQGANLNLEDPGLQDASLERLDLQETHFGHTRLHRVDFNYSNLTNANFDHAELAYVDFSDAILTGTSFFRTIMSHLRLSDVKGFVFDNFPSITLLATINLERLPDDLTLELMRRDAYAHPYPGRFAKWAKKEANGDDDDDDDYDDEYGGSCPYQNEMEFWNFRQHPKLWKRGNPTMKDRDLIVSICRAKGWGIKGHLRPKDD